MFTAAHNTLAVNKMHWIYAVNNGCAIEGNGSAMDVQWIVPRICNGCAIVHVGSSYQLLDMKLTIKLTNNQ